MPQGLTLSTVVAASVVLACNSNDDKFYSLLASFLTNNVFLFLVKDEFLSGPYSAFPHVAGSQCGFVRAVWFPGNGAVTPKMSVLKVGRGGGCSCWLSCLAMVEALAAATLQYNISIVSMKSKSLSFCSTLPFPINLQSKFDTWEGDRA